LALRWLAPPAAQLGAPVSVSAVQLEPNEHVAQGESAPRLSPGCWRQGLPLDLPLDLPQSLPLSAAQ
jgi:hypothetical protein